jgi:hypothetical protein
MRAILGLSAAALAALLISATAGYGADMTIPDVSVTAPDKAPVPEYKKWSPYATKLRVEEQLWPEIPCDKSRISLPGTSKCQTGGPSEPWAPGIKGSTFGQRCDLMHHLVNTTAGRLRIEADILVFDPYKLTASGPQHRMCTVESWFKDMPEDFKDMNQMTRQGRDWRNFVQSDEQSSIDFTIGTNHCRAIEKTGPRWGHGYVYIYHASLCRTDGRALEVIDTDYLFGAVRVVTYDPVGNLRGPP